MVDYNAITINGLSSKNLGFYCGVEENSPPQMPKKKDKLYDLDRIDGVLVQEVQAYEPVQTKFMMYLYNASHSDIRRFKSWIGYKGCYSTFDNPLIERKFFATEVKFENGVTDGSYQVEVTFTCEPFEYSKEVKTYKSTHGGPLTYYGTAPAYPIVTISGNAGTLDILQIGKRQMFIKGGLNYEIKIDCRVGFQNVIVGGKVNNSLVSGNFFVLLNGKNEITLTENINNIKIVYQEAYI